MNQAGDYSPSLLNYSVATSSANPTAWLWHSLHFLSTSNSCPWCQFEGSTFQYLVPTHPFSSLPLKTDRFTFRSWSEFQRVQTSSLLEIRNGKKATYVTQTITVNGWLQMLGMGLWLVIVPSRRLWKMKSEIITQELQEICHLGENKVILNC